MLSLLVQYYDSLDMIDVVRDVSTQTELHSFFYDMLLVARGYQAICTWSPVSQHGYSADIHPFPLLWERLYSGS